MLKHRFVVLIGVALAVLALGAAAVLAANPKDGTYVGEVGSGNTAEKITFKVDGNKISGTLCHRGMRGKINGSKFSAAYRGPGGVYMGVHGSFPTKTTAKGVVTTDYICDPSTKGVHFTAKRK